MSKKLILTQEQLDEICNGNSAYLDNPTDFKHNGNNEVNVDGVPGDYYGEGDKVGGKVTTDKYGKMVANPIGFPGYGSRGNGKDGFRAPIFFYESTKKNWEKKNLDEEYRDPTMTNATFTTGNVDEKGNKEKRGLGSMKTLKTRYRAAQALARSTDPEKRKRGKSTLNTMDKNDPNLKYELGQYATLQANAKNMRKNEKELFGKPEIDRRGKSNGTGSAKSKKDDPFSDGIISYDA